jgi:diketogulonate reductase-like aldo/keto reductase
LVQIAARHGVTPFDVALAWLEDLSEAIVAILTVASRPRLALARVHQIRLTDEDRAELDERFRTVRCCAACARAPGSGSAAVARVADEPDNWKSC